MPVPALYGAVMASASSSSGSSNVSSGRQAVAHLENLPLLVAQDSVHSLSEQDSKLPRFVHRFVARSVVNRVRGVVLVAASALAFSWVAALPRTAPKALPAAEALFWQSLVAWLLNCVAVGFTRTKLGVKRKLRKALALTCVASWCAAMLGLYAMHRLVLGNALAILYTSPLLTLFVARRVLKEKVLLLDFVAVVVALVGVVLVVQPTYIFGEPKHWYSIPASVPRPHLSRFTRLLLAVVFGSAVAVACAVAGSVSQALTFVGLRALRKLPHLAVMHYLLLLSAVLSLAALLATTGSFSFAIGTTAEAWGVALGTGALAFVGQLFLTRGLQFEPAGPAAVVRLLDVALLLAWDLALEDAAPNAWRYAGAAILCAGVALVPFRKLRGHWAIKRRLGL